MIKAKALITKKTLHKRGGKEEEFWGQLQKSVEVLKNYPSENFLGA